MRCAFVRYIEHYGGETGDRAGANIAVGEAAESREAFIKCHADAAVPVTIISWFEIPENWKNAVTGASNHLMNDALDAVLALNALCEEPVVYDFLATVFNAGFECGQKHQMDTQSPPAEEGAVDSK